MKNRLLVILVSCFFMPVVYGQIGGGTVFNFLELPSTARTTALGSRLISVSDDDGALAYHNPATLSDSADGQISFNYNFLYGRSKHGLLAYAHHLEKSNITLGGQIKFIGYGDLIETDRAGNELGTIISPSELAINISASKQVYNRLRLGGNIKYIQSSIGVYGATGLALDLGAYYEVKESGLSLGLVVNHLGRQLSSFSGIRGPLPTNVQLGLSKRLKHMPFRFSVTAHHLNRWNLQYDNPFNDSGTFILGEEETESTEGSAIDNVFRHLIFSGEFLLGKFENVRLRLGYNHMLRKDLAVVSNSTSFNGLSFGFGLRVSKFRFDYGRGFHHVAGGTHHITLSTSLSSFGAKR